MNDYPNDSAPALRHLCRITARVAGVVTLGMLPCGERRYVSIVGGTVEGGAFTGEVNPGGVDWQVLRTDGTLEIEAQYVLRLADGALVEVESRGYRHGPADVMQRLVAGEAVAPHEYYFRTGMRFRTSAPQWIYLNSVLAIGKAIRRPNAAVLDVFLVE